MKRSSRITRKWTTVVLFLTILPLFIIINKLRLLIHVTSVTKDTEEVPLMSSDRLPTATGLLVNTSTCMLPDYHPWDRSIAGLIKKEEPFPGCPRNFSVRIEQTDKMLVMVQTESILTTNCNVECCFRILTRALEGKSDDGYSLSKEKRCFEGKSKIEARAEFVRVRCFCRQTPDDILHEDFRVFFKEKSRSSIVHTSAKYAVPSDAKDPRLDTFIFGLDSVSRLGFKRFLPKIEQVLEEDFDAIPMLGLTKVGINTFPNMLAFLTGRTMGEMNQTLRTEPFDSQPFIWKYFSTLGYTTMFNEDLAKISTFNYMKKGFFHQPTDYYMRPLNVAMEESKYLRITKTLCMNQRIQLDVQIDWFQAFMNQTSDKRLFSLMFNSALSHEGPLSYVKHMQPRLEQFFHWYRNSARYNSSIMVFFSDHGMRFGPVMHYELGGYESRLPFFYILLPPWYAKMYPERVANLRVNSHRLTTFFDVHAMLRQVLQDGGATKLPWMNSNGISLFKPIPVERSCDDAGISEHWCVCSGRKPLAVDQKVVQLAAQAAVKYINEVKLRDVSSMCARLQLSNVTEALLQRDQKEVREQDTQASRKSFREYVVKFVTQPGWGEFEASVRLYSEEQVFSVLDVSRINVYHGQSDCLTQHFDERRFCFCADNVEKS